VPSEEKIAANPRARAASLRAGGAASRRCGRKLAATARRAEEGLSDAPYPALRGLRANLRGAYLYRIKMESTVRNERVLKLHANTREERDAFAALRAELARLQPPVWLQGLEWRLSLKPVETTPSASRENLPERPPSFVRSSTPDPARAILDVLGNKETTIGSIPDKTAEDTRWATPT
jgi:hypothetical protein